MNEDVRAGRGTGAKVTGLLRSLNGPQELDQRAVLCSVAEVAAADGMSHVVEEYGLVSPDRGPGWRWVVRAACDARTAYACARYRSDVRRHRSTLKATAALRAAHAELEALGSVVHRQPCPHCHLGIWRKEPDDWVHAATNLPGCPDGQGTDSNTVAVRGFGDLPSWPPTGSCW